MSKIKESKLSGAGKTLTASIPMIGFVLFGLIPLALAILMAFTKLHSTRLSEAEFVGLDNFVTILTNADKRTYASYLSTFIFLGNLVVCIAVSMWLGYLMSKIKRGYKIYSVIMFIPSVCSTVVVGMAFKILFKTEGGSINSILTALGFETVGWMTDSNALFVMITYLLMIWLNLGMMVTLFGAAYRSVDKTYYEAAMLDGATDRQVFWKITFPAISTTTGHLVTFGLIGNMQMMAETYILTTGGAFALTWGDSEAWISDTVVRHIYNMLFSYPDRYGYGMAAAAGLILSVVILIITRVNLKLQGRWVNYDF